MISLDNIFENIIAEVIVLGLSALLSIFLPNLFKKEECIPKEKKFDMLKVLIFLTSISVLNLILNLSFWENQKLTILFTLLSIGFGISSTYVYSNQCPLCKKFIGAKNKIDEKKIKEYTKEIPYQPLRVIKYSNGRVKKREPWGHKKTRTEKWETKQEFYRCNFCKHEWDSGQIDKPIFIEKEAHKIINTNERDPEEQDFY
jgi:hypothetical protein